MNRLLSLPNAWRVVLWGLLPLVLSVAPSLTGAEKKPIYWKEIKKKIKIAQATRNPAAYSKIVDILAPTGTARAAETIIERTPFGLDHVLERKVGKALAGMTELEARNVIYRALEKDSRYRARIVLLAVAYHHYREHNYPEALEALIHRLGDTDGTVLLTTGQWLGKLKEPAAVSALIKLLKREEKRPYGRLYRDVLDVLKGTTGEELTIAADWKNYWETRKNGVPRKKKGQATTRVRKPDFFGVEINSDRVVFLLDVSSSMVRKDPPIIREPVDKKKKKGSTAVRKKKPKVKEVDPKTLPIERERMFRVKKELQRAINRLPPETSFTVVSFSHEVLFLGKSPKLLRATSANKTSARSWVSSMKANGYTWTDTAFEKVFKEVKNFDTLVFLSDGMPRRDAQNKIPRQDVLKKLREITRFKKVRIHSIGFEQAGDNLKRFLHQVAQDNDGSFTSLE